MFGNFKILKICFQTTKSSLQVKIGSFSIIKKEVLMTFILKTKTDTQVNTSAMYCDLLAKSWREIRTTSVDFMINSK